MIVAHNSRGERHTFPDDAAFVSWVMAGNHRAGVIRAFSLEVLDGGAGYTAESAAASFPLLAPPSMSSTGPGVPPLPAPGPVVPAS